MSDIIERFEAILEELKTRMIDTDIHHATGERITRRDLNNAHAEGAKQARLFEEFMSSAQSQQIQDMAMLIRMLARHIPADKSVRQKADAYLKKHNLEGSPLRASDELFQSYFPMLTPGHRIFGTKMAISGVSTEPSFRSILEKYYGAGAVNLYLRAFCNELDRMRDEGFSQSDNDMGEDI